MLQRKICQKKTIGNGNEVWFISVARESLTDQVTFGQKSKGNKGSSHEDSWEMIIPGSRKLLNWEHPHVQVRRPVWLEQSEGDVVRMRRLGPIMWCDSKTSNFYAVSWKSLNGFELRSVRVWLWVLKMITPAGVCEEEPIEGKVRNGDQAKTMENQGGSGRGKNLLVDQTMECEKTKRQHRCNL